MKRVFKNKVLNNILLSLTGRGWGVGLLAMGLFLLSSCEDFFDQESDHVMFADNEHLNNATDTIYSVTGIMSKMQKLADRTILLGEARADLVDVTNATDEDLRNVALFNIDDDNIYNQPRDYYAVINNCNYFLAHVDTTLRNGRNEEIFKCEYTAVKCFRAWTYLQLAINYGRIPFVTEPILTKEEAETMERGAQMDIQSVCQWLINDLTPLADLQYMRYNPYTKTMHDVGENPLYGDIGYKTASALFYFPTKLLLGELNLWAGNYKEAALWYYRYISERNGSNSIYPTGTDRIEWKNTSWTALDDYWSSALMSESYYNRSELITMIPGDSIPYNGNYLQLRNIFNSTDPVTREYHEVSLVPSQGLIDLSAAQTYCKAEERDTLYAPKDLSDYRSGDLRLRAAYSDGYTVHQGNRVTTQRILKYQSRNAHIWRRTMVWLHLAEALNCAGYPRFAYQILARGVNNNIIKQEVIPYYSADSTWLAQFDFPATQSGYVIYNPNLSNSANTQGIHTRGSGCSYMNKYYQMPDDTLITDSLQRIAYQQDKVEKMISDEGALEFAFEGQRFYDLVRFALRRNDPAFLADRIYARRGADKRGEMEAEIKKSLLDQRNWFLNWKGKIGY